MLCRVAREAQRAFVSTISFVLPTLHGEFTTFGLACVVRRGTKSHSGSEGKAMRYSIWGSVLSPFSIKVRAMCDFKRVDYEWLPR
jgi:hypothetical protein